MRKTIASKHFANKFENFEKAKKQTKEAVRSGKMKKEKCKKR